MGAANMSAGLLSDIHAGTVYGWTEWIGCKADRVKDRREQVSREYSVEFSICRKRAASELRMVYDAYIGYGEYHVR